jgi:PKD repeat protein
MSQSAYTASFSASNTIYGTSAATSSRITIDQPITAFFTTSNNSTLRGNIPLNVTFSNQSTYGSTYLWTFGTGSKTSTVAGLTGTGVTCSYTTANEGAALYTVSLAVSGTFGSSSLFTSASMISASNA